MVELRETAGIRAGGAERPGEIGCAEASSLPAASAAPSAPHVGVAMKPRLNR